MKRRTVNSLIAAFLSMMISFLVVGGAINQPSVLAEETTETSAQNKDISREEMNLFCGYNVTGGVSLMESGSIPKNYPIIDPKSDYIDHINCYYESGSQSVKNFSGSSLQEVENQFAMSIMSGNYGKIYCVDMNLDAQFNLNKRTDTVYAEYYELWTQQIYRYQYTVDLDKYEIRNYLSENFKEDLYAVNSKEDAVKLFNKYGTHLSTGYSYGGIMNITNYQTTSESTVDFSQGTDLSTKVSAVVGAYGGGSSLSFSEKYADMENTSTSSSTYSYFSYGGTAVAGLTIDNLFNYNFSYDGSGKYEYGRWVDSINEDSQLAIIGIPNGSEMIPLWDLLDPTSNPQIRDYLVDAYTEMCGDKYDEYLASFPSIERTQKVEEVNTDSMTPSAKGAYIQTPNGYYYYVPNVDFAKEHNEVHPDEYIYLDLTDFDAEDYDYDSSQGCEVIDKKQGVFKVTGKPGDTFTVKFSTNGKETTLLSVDIKLCNGFEGGVGSSSYPFLIANSTQFSKLGSSTKKDAHYMLVSDIDFAGKSIEQLGSFSGTFDGNYCTISNFIIKGDSSSFGIFKSVNNDGVIKNLSVEKAGTACKKSDFDSKVEKLEDMSTEKIGIICGENNGVIEDCYFSDVYIYVASTKENRTKDTSITAGTIAGVNKNTISNCMVKDCSVFAVSVDKGRSNKNSMYLYVGALVGEMDSGKVENCVVSLNKDCLIEARTGNNNEINVIKDDNEISTFASGLIGYCKKNSNATIQNVFVSIDNKNVICVKNENFGKIKSNPDTYHHLSAIAVISADDNPTIQDCYGYCDDDSFVCITVGDKDGDNTDKKSHDEFVGNTIKKSQLSQGTYNDIKLPEGVFEYTSSEIVHLLSKEKADYIRLTIDTSDSEMKQTYIVDDMFTMKGLDLSYVVNDEEQNDRLLVFELELIKNGTISIDTISRFDETGDSIYSVKISAYSKEVVMPDSKSIVVSDNAIDSFIMNSNCEEPIYLDSIETYLNSWSTDDVTITAVMANGNKVDITSDSEEISDGSFVVLTKPESIIGGYNTIKVKYVTSNYEVTTEYGIDVTEREVEKIEIEKEPSKLEYNVGDKITLSNLSDMVVRVYYTDGFSKTLDSFEDIELIGDTVVAGENTIWITYDGYSKKDSIKVTGLYVEPEINDETSEGKNSNIGIVITSVIVVLLGGGAVWFFYNKKKKNSNSKSKAKQEEDLNKK